VTLIEEVEYWAKKIMDDYDRLPKEERDRVKETG
jgi:hypothetical protein